MTAGDEQEAVERAAPTVGERLRAARKKKKLSLEDVASQTRIPQRHLASIEDSDWANLPAPTYTVGFAKSYASVVDLDRAEIGEALRTEMGGTRTAVMAEPEVFEPADPARTMPKWLVIGAIVAALLVAGVLSWLNNRSLSEDEGVANEAVVAAPGNQATPPPAPAAPQGPVVLSATEPLWLAVKDGAGASLFAGILKPGTDFTIPPGSAAPTVSTARPESLRIMVGTTQAPPLGPPGREVRDASLLPADLLRGPAPAAASTTPAATTAPPARPAPVRRPPPPAAPAPEPAPEANSGA